MTYRPTSIKIVMYILQNFYYFESAVKFFHMCHIWNYFHFLIFFITCDPNSLLSILLQLSYLKYLSFYANILNILLIFIRITIKLWINSGKCRHLLFLWIFPILGTWSYPLYQELWDFFEIGFSGLNLEQSQKQQHGWVTLQRLQLAHGKIIIHIFALLSAT